jgi:hypothetical protein
MRDLDETLNLGSLLYFRISSIMEEIPKMILDGYFDLYFIASNIFRSIKCIVFFQPLLGGLKYSDTS